MTDRLYGLPGAEQMQSDLETVYEQWLDDFMPFDDGDSIVLVDQVVTIEEWSVKDCVASPYDVEAAVENLIERLGDEGTEDYYDALESAAQSAEVLAAFQAAADLLCSKVGYRMADELIVTHTVTHVGDVAYLDSKPLFSKEA